ncbi:MAG TPA: sigma-70 family RNA polymerase sigma factor, partial [Acidimicrobiales bacterium]|nr:sigma-70 family RNA polymerase sigma factor [Acidimicrobiales bacterium]
MDSTLALGSAAMTGAADAGNAASAARAAGAARQPVELAAFYRAEFPRLAAALTLYTGDRELAAELAQEAMARACRHWGRLQHFDSPAAWVHRVGINLANSAWRRAGRRVDPAHGVESPRPHDPSTALAVRAAVARLPRRQRSALVLRYFVDLSVDDVARLLRCSPGTVKARTAQALANLRRTGARADDDAPD